MKCSNCSSIIPDDATFCPFCGLAASTPTPPTYSGSSGGVRDTSPYQSQGKSSFPIFDFKIATWITPKVILFLYIVAVLLGILSVAAGIIGGLVMIIGGNWMGLIGIVIIPIGFLMYWLFLRIWTETVLVFFRMVELLSEIRDLLKRG